MQPVLIDHEAVIRNIREFINGMPMKTPQYLHEWADTVCKTPSYAAELEYRIKHWFPILERDTLHTGYEWKQLAYLSSVNPSWNGYKDN